MRVLSRASALLSLWQEKRIACSPRRLPPVRAVAASRSESAQREEPLALSAEKKDVCVYPSIPKKSLAQSLSTRTMGSADCTRFAARCPYRRFLSISSPYLCARCASVQSPTAARLPVRGERQSRTSGTLMILPQVHLRKPCYDFYFL